MTAPHFLKTSVYSCLCNNCPCGKFCVYNVSVWDFNLWGNNSVSSLLSKPNSPEQILTLNFQSQTQRNLHCCYGKIPGFHESVFSLFLRNCALDDNLCHPCSWESFVGIEKCIWALLGSLGSNSISVGITENKQPRCFPNKWKPPHLQSGHQCPHGYLQAVHPPALWHTLPSQFAPWLQCWPVLLCE